MTPCPKCERYRKALQYIADHAWVIAVKPNAKWLEEFVCEAQQALKEERDDNGKRS